MSVNFLLKRTATADKRPTAAQLDVGELSLCYEAGDPGVFFEDSNGAVRKLGPVTVGGTAPNTNPAGSSGNSTGELWLDNSGGDNVLKVWDGTNWQTAASDNVAAAGSDTQVQFNDSGVLSGDAGFTYDAATNTITVGEVIGRHDGPITFTAKADQNLVLGDVVYISGAAGDTPTIDKARANSASTMPAFGLAMETISSGSTGQVVTLGSLEGSGSDPLDTSGLAVNEVVYVSSTTAGEWTTTKPTGEGNFLQNIGRVQRVQSSNGVIKVGGAGRSNATPNLNDGNIFIGDSNNEATTTPLSTAISARLGVVRTAGTGTNIEIDTASIGFKKDLAFDQASDITFPDNLSEALQMTDTLGVPYLTFNSTDSSEFVEFNKDLKISADSQIQMSGSTTITLLDNDFDALDIKEGNNLYMRFNTTNSGEKLQILKNIYLAAELHLADYLLMDNANQIRFAELNSQGTNYMAIQGAPTMSATTVLTLPASDGTADQSIRTDGSGTLSWKDTPTALFGINAHASFDASAAGSFSWATDKIAEGNITSVTRTATGKFTITFDRDFAGAAYTAVCTAGDQDYSGTGASPRCVNVVSRSAGSMDIVVERSDDAAQDDCGYIAVMVIGTLS